MRMFLAIALLVSISLFGMKRDGFQAGLPSLDNELIGVDSAANRERRIDVRGQHAQEYEIPQGSYQFSVCLNERLLAGITIASQEVIV